jgi:hypothetical protein
MEKRRFDESSVYECDLCHQEFVFLMAQGDRFLCNACFTSQSNRFEEECGRSQEDSEIFSNEG